MALTKFQRDLCRLIAHRRLENGVRYLAGGSALNAVTDGTRISRDLDLFHDAIEAVNASWLADRDLLESAGCRVHLERQREGFVEALVSRGDERVIMEWAADSAFRFFPLIEHADLGLILHPFDLATNKVLALVGRLEARDWIDVLTSHDRIQRLGYLAWAACGKDPGFSPGAILNQAARTARYTQAEISALAFQGETPAAASLSRQWHSMLDEAREIVAALPPHESGKSVLDAEGNLFMGGAVALQTALREGQIRFHEGSICGAFPAMRPSL